MTKPTSETTSTQTEQSENDHPVAIGERQAITINNDQYKLQARVLWDDEKPAAGLSVAVYDKDTLKRDDFLGKTVTADDGGFDLLFKEKDFKGILDSKPDLYFIITDAEGKELFNTKKYVINNADENTTPITLIL